MCDDCHTDTIPSGSEISAECFSTSSVYLKEWRMVWSCGLFLDLETQILDWHMDFWNVFWSSIFYFVLFCTIFSVINYKHSAGKDGFITRVDIVTMYHNPVNSLSGCMT